MKFIYLFLTINFFFRFIRGFSDPAQSLLSTSGLFVLVAVLMEEDVGNELLGFVVEGTSISTSTSGSSLLGLAAVLVEEVVNELEGTSISTTVSFAFWALSPPSVFGFLLSVAKCHIAYTV